MNEYESEMYDETPPPGTVVFVETVELESDEDIDTMAVVIDGGKRGLYLVNVCSSLHSPGDDDKHVVALVIMARDVKLFRTQAAASHHGVARDLEYYQGQADKFGKVLASLPKIGE